MVGVIHEHEGVDGKVQLTFDRETVALYAGMTTATATASIRELRTDFRAVKRKLEAFGRITITDNGEPAYVMEPITPSAKKRGPLPDYYARLLKEQPVPLTAEQARQLHEEIRGDR